MEMSKWKQEGTIVHKPFICFTKQIKLNRLFCSVFLFFLFFLGKQSDILNII